LAVEYELRTLVSKIIFQLGAVVRDGIEKRPRKVVAVQQHWRVFEVGLK
jgi:hypothetical protein